MDRLRTQGSLDRATGTMKEKPGEAPGDRHVGRAEKTDAPRSTKSDPAVLAPRVRDMKT